MSRNLRINLLLVLTVVAVAVLPVLLGMGDHKPEPFTGADAEAEVAIQEINPDYRPWFSPVYEPPSGEIESGLFALQAAVGAGVVAYCLGLWRGRRQGEARAAAAARAPSDPAGDGTPATPVVVDADAQAPAGSGLAARGVPDDADSGRV
ncbi:energy-coupling factor ABC transporter substrate-binding protein [Streptomyces fragilis]|uniref:Cobalt transport protein CbiN n=1 Tax=Streptomyces fragilis TaxID=67301 RepID=A0ABV2YHV8_9ACTN|nr:energy-coupling factor ABC transporter substrate-binding protein [Streptomyces fragilis]